MSSQYSHSIFDNFSLVSAPLPLGNFCFNCTNLRLNTVLNDFHFFCTSISEINTEDYYDELKPNLNFNLILKIKFKKIKIKPSLKLIYVSAIEP